MRLIDVCPRHVEDLVRAELPAPTIDVDDVQQPALDVGEKDRADAVREAIEALDGGERLHVRRRIVAAGRQLRPARIEVAAEQQHARRDGTVLVARERRDAQHLDDRCDAIDPARARPRVRPLVEERADVAILDRTSEELAALRRQLRIENRVIPRANYRHNRARHAHLMRRERAAAEHVQRVDRAAPGDVERRGIRRLFDRQRTIGARGCSRLDLERRAAEELPQRRLEDAFVEGTEGGSGRNRHVRGS